MQQNRGVSPVNLPRQKLKKNAMAKGNTGNLLQHFVAIMVADKIIRQLSDSTAIEYIDLFAMRPWEEINQAEDQFKKRIRINTKVLVSQKVIKTVRAVRRGEILSNDEIKVETIQTERPLKNAITNINSALGYEATRNISIGKILIQNFIKKPALGNRGDKVLITAKKGAMTITTPGILKEDGYEDAMVRVLNMESKKIIYGRLIDSNTVKVTF